MRFLSVNTLSVFERISMDGRPKCIEMYAFSNENALVWTGPRSNYISPSNVKRRATNRSRSAVRGIEKQRQSIIILYTYLNCSSVIQPMDNC